MVLKPVGKDIERWLKKGRFTARKGIKGCQIVLVDANQNRNLPASQPQQLHHESRDPEAS